MTLVPADGPLLIVLSGPSGVGKDSVIRRLRPRLPNVHVVVTLTTRPPRNDEVPGKDYIFVTREAFERMMGEGELIAAADVHGHWYGAPKSQIKAALAAGDDVLLKVDVKGAAEIREKIAGTRSIFLAPPTFEDLVGRLRARHSEDSLELNRRIRDARYEMEQVDSFDYLVINRDDVIEDAVEAISCIFRAEHQRVHREPIDLAFR